MISAASPRKWQFHPAGGTIRVSRFFLKGLSWRRPLKNSASDRLDAEARLAVAEALWESVAREADAASLSAAQRAELECRLADSIARPGAVTPWETVKARALARARQ